MAEQNSKTISTRNTLIGWAVFLIILFVVAFYWAIVGMPGGAHPVTEAEKIMMSERLKPIGTVNTGEAIAAAVPAAAAGPRAAQDIFGKVCTACHSTGAAGAPRVGNKDEWGPRIAKGKDVLLQSALNGFKAMPVKGGDASLTEEELKATIDYMIAQTTGEGAVAPAKQPAAAPAAPAEQPAAAPAAPAEQPAAAPAAPAEQPAAAPAGN